MRGAAYVFLPLLVTNGSLRVHTSSQHVHGHPNRGTEQFLLPCVENLLVDVDGGVVEEALGCMEKFALMELVTGPTLVRLVEKYAALVLHPAAGVRGKAAAFAQRASARLGEERAGEYILPNVERFLKYEPTWGQMQDSILEVAKPAVSEVRTLSRTRRRAPFEQL